MVPSASTGCSEYARLSTSPKQFTGRFRLCIQPLLLNPVVDNVWQDLEHCCSRQTALAYNGPYSRRAVKNQRYKTCLAIAGPCMYIQNYECCRGSEQRS
jgi:hypothetical protein